MTAILQLLSRLLRADLAGRFSSVKHTYRRTPWVIGADEVVCVITDWLGSRSEVCASCYCSDPHASDMANVIWFYRKTMRSRDAADTHLLQQVIRAQALHPETRFFYRRRKQGGFEEYIDGAWHPATNNPAATRCNDCGKPATPPTCSACGGFVLGQPAG